MTRNYITYLKSPRIENVSHSPGNIVQTYENVAVYANVADYGSGLKSVWLNYTTTWASNWSLFPMTVANPSTGLYGAVIPGQQANTTVIYSIIAYDNANNSKVDDKCGLYYSYSVIPEFSSLLILPLVMLATALVAIVYKKKRALV
jgi:hypothetical protein